MTFATPAPHGRLPGLYTGPAPRRLARLALRAGARKSAIYAPELAPARRAYKRDQNRRLERRELPGRPGLKDLLQVPDRDAILAGGSGSLAHLITASRPGEEAAPKRLLTSVIYSDEFTEAHDSRETVSPTSHASSSTATAGRASQSSPADEAHPVASNPPTALAEDIR